MRKRSSLGAPDAAHERETERHIRKAESLIAKANRATRCRTRFDHVMDAQESLSTAMAHHASRDGAGERGPAGEVIGKGGHDERIMRAWAALRQQRNLVRECIR